MTTAEFNEVVARNHTALGSCGAPPWAQILHLAIVETMAAQVATMQHIERESLAEALGMLQDKPTAK